MLIQESLINESKGYRIFDSEPYEPFTDNIGELFLSLQKEYGCCTSKMYIDLKNGSVQQVGYCFQKKVKYIDTEEFYIQSAWITFLSELDTVTRTHHYYNLRGGN